MGVVRGFTSWEGIKWCRNSNEQVDVNNGGWSRDNNSSCGSARCGCTATFTRPLWVPHFTNISSAPPPWFQDSMSLIIRLKLGHIDTTEYVGIMWPGIKSTAADLSGNGVVGRIGTRSCIGVGSSLAGVTNSKFTRELTSVADGMVGM
jgi:hypothetical protein